MRYGQPVEACGTLLNPEAPGSSKIIYSTTAGPNGMNTKRAEEPSARVTSPN